MIPRRNWSIRGKLTALLLLPLVSLATLWAYAAHLSLGNALVLRHENTIGTHLADPLARLVIALRHERRDSMVTLASGSQATDLPSSRGASDAAMRTFLVQAEDAGVRGAESSTVRQGVDEVQRTLRTLPELRRSVDGRTASTATVLSRYGTIGDSIAEALRRMTILPDQSAQDFGQALYTLVPSGDLMAQEDALISAAAAGPTHHFDTAGYSAVVQDIGAQRLLTRQGFAELPPAQRAPFLALAAPGGSLAKVTAMEDALIAAGPRATRLPFTIQQWQTAYNAEERTSGETAIHDISVIFTRTGPPARRAFIELILAALLGLIALVVSVIMSIRISRSLIGDVARLNDSARNLTDDQLRDVVGRLRRGESVDVRSDMTDPVFVNREMAELGAAFGALQLTAVELAEEDVRLHSGVSAIFVNLARRSQTLVHRQLAMLDSMEQAEEDPVRLESLFRLDQLATRMRRYAEGLIIVSGAPPGRLWRYPVPAVDVVRGAIAETEEYARVVVLPVPAVGIVGRAAADVIHLLAELVENAEVFSPSDSEVRVSLGAAAGGLIVEIDDRGLGMPPDELAEANTRLGSPLDVTDLDSTRLGLVTVGRLAQRHGIAVSLRKSAYGGVNAVILIPQDLLEWGVGGHQSVTGADRPQMTGLHRSRQPLAVTGEERTGRDGIPDLTSAGSKAAWGAPVAYGPLSISPPGPTRDTPPDEPVPPLDTDYGGGLAVDRMPQPGHPEDPLGDPDLIDGLPRRVPQASLARELQEEAAQFDAGAQIDWGGADPLLPPAGQEPWWGPEQPVPPAVAPTPSSDEFGGHGMVRRNAASYVDPVSQRPEQVRSIMSALQAGAARARSKDGEVSGYPGAVPAFHDPRTDGPGHVPSMDPPRGGGQDPTYRGPLHAAPHPDTERYDGA